MMHNREAMKAGNLNAVDTSQMNDAELMMHNMKLKN